MKPLIGIPTRTQTVDNITFHALASTYTRALDLAGGTPLLIPLRLGEEALRDIFARLDGLLLAGGVDLHPREYGESVEPFCGEIDEARDAAELRLTRWAMQKHMPILAICRGIQTLNVAMGGSLYQDLAAQVANSLPHRHVKGNPYNLLVHSIEIDTQSALARTLGATHVEVNSLHHQAVKQVAPGFHSVARAPDGVIEGIEADDGRFALGVQFHPEWLHDDDTRMLRLFAEFVRASQNGGRSTA
jgi:putative glutamine amidotransferase